jgi:hypothetical protein
VVTKRVPGFDHVLYRLRARSPKATQEDIEAQARKFVDHIVPTFLTREAAFLQILERDLPEPYCQRVPKLLQVEKNKRGFVTRIDMNWMRTGGPPISQLDFARQSAELLHVLHDKAKIMHLDMRLDNFVVTDQGVGFVDVGSAVRIGEDLSQSPMLRSIFEVMMRTRQIQRMLGKMLDNGEVTNPTITNGHQRVDQAVDAFYLAVQINQPRSNPQFSHLVHHDPASLEAQSLSALTAAILRHKHPDKSAFKTTGDILRGIYRIEQKLARTAA